MADGSPLDRLSGTDKIDPTRAAEPTRGGVMPESGKFSEYMKSPNQAMTTNPPNQITPMQAAQNQAMTPNKLPTPQTLQAQMNTTSSSLGDIKNQLHTKGLKLKQSDKYLLRNKLGQADQHLRTANQHLGGDPGVPVNLKSTKNPLNKFLAMVADGQHQLNSAATQLRNLNSSGQEINAGEMLLVQVKLQKAQQELDYTSVLLGKAVELVKTLLNVQI